MDTQSNDRQSGAKEFVAGLVKGVSGGWLSILPAVIFLVAVFLAFATGTSWGTFGILIPIVVNTFSGNEPYNDDYINLSMYGWSCLWRPLFTNI